MKISDLPIFMIKALAITIVIEVFVAFVLHYRKKDLINVLLVNVITNPLVVSIPVYINVKYGLLERNIVLIIMEIMTIIVEGYIYSRFNERKKINPYILSFILNLSSYMIGVLINYVF